MCCYKRYGQGHICTIQAAAAAAAAAAEELHLQKL